MAIRRARTADLDALLSLIADYCAIDEHAYDEARVRAALVPLLDDDRFGVVLVADAGDGLIGYAVITWGWSLESGGMECLLDEIYVADRGQGTGSALLTAGLDAARAHGARTMFLETEAPNERARAFYARHGFTLEDSQWMGRRLH